MNHESIILGSSSYKRAEILGFFSLPFEQIPSNFDERSIEFTGDPAAYCELISKHKALTLNQQFPDKVILTADTIVFCNQKLYHKPQDRKEAFQFLSEFSENWCSVYTGVTVCKGEFLNSAVEETKVLFNKLLPECINVYLNHIDYVDKSGAFTTDKGAGIILSRIDGCYHNIGGLPINTLRELLLKVGLDLWHFLKI